MEMILVEIENDICTLTINRPKQYNALNIDVLKELELKLDWILDETSVRVVIITGKGEKAFIAGADIHAMNVMNEKEAESFSRGVVFISQTPKGTQENRNPPKKRKKQPGKRKKIVQLNRSKKNERP